MHPTSKTLVALPAALLAGLLFAIPAPAAETDPAVVAIDAFIADQKIDRSSPNWKTRLTQPPQLTFTQGKTYYWRLETNHGPIMVKFLPDVAPLHVSSAIYLTRLGFYDGTRFHRVIPGFMAQGGDPLGNGRGGPGYRFDLEVRKDVKHDKPGILSAANKGPRSDGSQFFLTFAPAPHLDGGYSIYGEVTAGMRVLEKFEERGSKSGRPKESLMLNKATIEVR